MWTVAVREVAGYDPDRIAHVLKWKISDLLLRFLYLRKKEALDLFKTQLMIHAFLAPYKKKQAGDQGPQLPLFAEIVEG